MIYRLTGTRICVIALQTSGRWRHLVGYGNTADTRIVLVGFQGNRF
jgi:hypothetical protein